MGYRQKKPTFLPTCIAQKENIFKGKLFRRISFIVKLGLTLVIMMMSSSLWSKKDAKVAFARDFLRKGIYEIHFSRLVKREWNSLQPFLKRHKSNFFFISQTAPLTTGYTLLIYISIYCQTRQTKWSHSFLLTLLLAFLIRRYPTDFFTEYIISP